MNMNGIISSVENKSISNNLSELCVEAITENKAGKFIFEYFILNKINNKYN